MIVADLDDGNESQSYNCTNTTLPAGYRVITIKLWAYGKFNSGVAKPYGDINWAGCSEKEFTAWSTVIGWRSVSWTGLNLTTQTHVNSLIMYINSKGMGAKGFHNVWAMYLELTTEYLGPGTVGVFTTDSFDRSSVLATFTRGVASGATSYFWDLYHDGEWETTWYSGTDETKTYPVEAGNTYQIRIRGFNASGYSLSYRNGAVHTNYFLSAAKVSGVDNGDISEINGIPINDIKNINGVE